uniref:Uncharacterized protein n=1 Tax=Rhizophora mucronata TaxID=61149 RepID=A0A2P2JHX9_RHIMU
MIMRCREMRKFTTINFPFLSTINNIGARASKRLL